MSAINKELQVGVVKPNTVRARRYTKSLFSLAQNSSYGENDQIIFNIPVGVANSFIDGRTMYLKFTMTLTWTASADLAANACTAYLDYTASCFIRTLTTVSNGSQQMEKIDRYNVLANIIYDTTFTQSQLKSLSPLIGCDDGDTTDATNRYGESFNNSAITYATSPTTTTSRTFCTPIFSGAVGQLSEKYIPIYAMSGDSLKLELVLDTNANAIKHNAPAGLTSCKFTIVNPELFYDVVEVDSSAMAGIEALYSGKDIVLHSSSYTTYEASLASGVSGTTNLILPSRLLSAKSIWSVHRSAAVQAQAGWTLSAFSNIFEGVNSTWNLSLSGTKLPQKALTNRLASGGDVSQFFAELQKSNHALAYTDYNGTLNQKAYKSGTNTAVTATPNETGFIVGLNLCSITNSEDSILSGIDLYREQTHIEYNISTALTQAFLVTTFIYHDLLLTIGKDTGLMTANF